MASVYGCPVTGPPGSGERRVTKPARLFSVLSGIDGPRSRPLSHPDATTRETGPRAGPRRARALAAAVIVALAIGLLLLAAGLLTAAAVITTAGLVGAGFTIAMFIDVRRSRHEP